MNLFLISLLLVGMVEPKPKSPAAAPQQPFDCSQSTGDVVVVADGSPGWSGDAADEIVDQLRAKLVPCRSVYVAWFDAEPAHGVSPKTADEHVLRLQPRTPMKDAVSIALKAREGAGPTRVMILVAHKQSYPTYVGTNDLISSLRRSEVTVHTIELAKGAQGSVLQRFGRTVTSGFVWLVEALIEEDRQDYSAEDTARMLKRISEETGGQACVASDRETGLRCAEAVAAGVTLQNTNR
jgi:hypothetical protein